MEAHRRPDEAEEESIMPSIRIIAVPEIEASHVSDDSRIAAGRLQTRDDEVATSKKSKTFRCLGKQILPFSLFQNHRSNDKGIKTEFDENNREQIPQIVMEDEAIVPVERSQQIFMDEPVAPVAMLTPLRFGNASHKSERHCAVFSEILRDAIVRHTPVEEIKSILNTGVVRGITLWNLIVAAFQVKASSNVVQLLIRHDPTCCRFRDTTRDEYLLHLACRHSASRDVIQLLLDLNPHVIREADGKGMLPLHIACSKTDASLGVIELLLLHYPDSIRSPITNGTFPLMLAIDMHASFEVIKYLLARDSSIAKEADGLGRLPVHCACTGLLGPWNLDVISLLVKTYPNSLRVADNFGSLPLHDVAQTIARRAPDEPEEEATTIILRIILNGYPSAVRKADYRGLLPLHMTCVDCPLAVNLDRVRELLAVDLSTILHESNYGHTPLELAWRHHLSFATKAFLLDKQNEALLVYGYAFDAAMDAAAFPDLVVAEIWSYAQPDIWMPTPNNLGATDLDSLSVQSVRQRRGWRNVAGTP